WRGGGRSKTDKEAASRCHRCAAASYSTVTATTTPAEAPASASAPYDIRSGLILTRPPIITPRQHPFESAFYFYQKRLEERLNSPFIPSIYFKPDTPRRMEWDLKIREREGSVAKELGVYHGKGSTAWQDELKVGDDLSSPDSMLSSLLRDAEVRVSEDAEVIPAEDVTPVELPASRETEADRKNDVRRLDRKLDRTLYLVVKGPDGNWAFPADVVPAGENLHECAQRVIDQAAGVNMNTWIVGRVPVAHVIDQTAASAKDGKIQKTFLLKGRIMAGQANIKGNPFGYTDFQWLTREELEKELPPAYFKGVRNMMSDR
ncbi:large subunit ribosomal protein L46, partial [Geosmithia morbida]